MGLESRPKVKRETNGKVNDRFCSSMRELGHDGVSPSEIVSLATIDISRSTVRYHIFGNCTHGENDDDFISPVSKEKLKILRYSDGEPGIALYPCGDIYINAYAMKQWGIGGIPAVDMCYNKRSCEVWIFFKQSWDEDYYLLDHNKTNDYSSRIQGTDSLLNELNINKPDRKIYLDFEWMPDNNVLYLDMLSPAYAQKR